MHRLLKYEGEYVTYEPVLNSKMKRASAEPTTCAVGFCGLLAPRLQRELEKRFGLALP